MKNTRRQTLLSLTALAFGISPVFSGSVLAKDWPTQPVTLVVPYPPGGNADNLGRLIGLHLSKKIGQPVVIDNKPGGGGIVGTNIVIRAKPDGHTLLLGTTPTFATLPVLQKLEPEPLDAVDVIGGVAGYVPVLAANPSLNVKTLGELIELARSKPGKLTFGSVGGGNPSHINIEIMKHATGIDMLHVPFKGSSQALTALIGGQIDLMVDGVTVQAAKAGRVVPLAAFAKTRHSGLPNVPTYEEAGVKMSLPVGAFGMFAPKGIPPAVMKQLQSALEDITLDPSFQSRAEELSLVSDWSTGAELRKSLEADLKQNREFLPRIGVTSAQ